MRFNKLIRKQNITFNYEDAQAYQLKRKLELYSMVVSSTLNDKFYESAGDRLQRLRGLLQWMVENDNEAFVARLAVYAREKMYLRTLPLVLTVELARLYKGDDLVRRLTRRVIQRADEITEILAYYQLANSRKNTKKLNRLSKQLQKGIGDAFNKFDAYQFAKYNRATEVKLRDALFLVHPKAKDDAQQKLFDKIASDTLEAAYTWETALSREGQEKFANEAEKAQAFRQQWEELIRSGKLGYMALLRNLRNLLEADVSQEALEQVLNRLADPEAVRRSKQLPFRFLAAYRELQSVASGSAPRVLDALEKAVLASVDNLKGFDAGTRVLIASDTSGSMKSPISKKSKVMQIDVGLILSMLLKAKCQNAITGIFGTDWKVMQMPTDQVLANVEKLSQANVGWATNGYKVIDDLIERRLVVDKVMIFTDMQLWNSIGLGSESTKTIESQWKVYKKLAPGAKVYLFDLAGYGQAPLNVLRDDVYMIAGWSDKVFDMLEALEDGSAAIAEIEKIEV